jgi:3-oxocholest-4-en-26-oate---CoA ligase
VEFNLADLFEAVVDTVPDAEALVCRRPGGDPRRATYAQLDARANQVAHLLERLGIGRDDHVGLHLRNGHEFVEIMLACYKLRAVPVNVNYRYVAEELAHLVVDAGLRVVFTEAELSPGLDLVRGRSSPLDAIVEVGPDLDRIMAVERSERPDVGPRSADDRYLLYTGGTTGPPKGVVWRHEDIYFAALGGRGTPSRGVPQLTEASQIVERVRRGDPIMRRLPLCPLIHGGAMWVALQTLLNGGALVLDTSHHFHAPTAVGLLSDERVELTMLIGDATARPIADELAADRGRPEPRYDLSALQVIASGGAVLSAAVIDQLHDLLPHVTVLNTFGASETGGQGRLRTSTADGRPRLVTDEHTSVFGDDLEPVAPGEVGRLARTGWVPLGYHGDEARSAATFPVVDGVRWSVPGDLARLEQDGTITVLGRGSTSINTGGEKVFPEEVENVLKGHPAVFDALVVGVPDDRYGEQVAAVIALRAPGDPSAAYDRPPDDDELDAHVRAHLAGYKVPRRWIRVDRCERLPTGKPDYRWAKEIAGSS